MSQECFGCRITVMLGGLLSGLAMSIASLARTITHIYIASAITGFVVDHTGRYSYIFYASSLCVTSAGLYIGGSFYFLDRKRDKEEERKNTRTPSDLQQRPAETRRV